MIGNFLKEPITFYPPNKNEFGQLVPDEGNGITLMCNANYENNWEMDGGNNEQYLIYLTIIIPADAPVDESWRVDYDGNMYTVWKVKFVRHPQTNRVLYKVVDSG